MRHDKKVGKLVDLIIKENGTLPVVVGLLISRPFGESSVVKWEQVKSFEAKTIQIEVDNLDTCPREPDEEAILLRDHILDKKALDLDGREIEVFYDNRLVNRNGKLYVTDVDLSRYGLLRRMGLKGLANAIYRLAESIQDQTISWTYIEPLPSRMGRFRGDVQLKVVKEALADMHPVDVADILEELDHEQRVKLFEGLEPEHASDTLEEVDPNVQRDLVASIAPEKAAQLIDEMTPGQAAEVPAALPAEDAKDIIAMLDEENRQKIPPILEEHEENILNLATDEYIKFPPEMTAEEVQDRYREVSKGKDVVMYLYIVDPQDHLLGLVDLKDLLQAEDKTLMKDIMNDNIISLDADCPLREALETFTRYDFRALPVTSEDHRILGVVTYRDMVGLKHRFVD
jgi:CBS domain-containing protein